MKRWYVYIVKCADGTLYTGISTNIERRIYEHNNTKKAAKYTVSRRPVVLKYFKEFDGRSDASKEEARIKKLSRVDKLNLIRSFQT